MQWTSKFPLIGSTYGLWKRKAFSMLSTQVPPELGPPVLPGTKEKEIIKKKITEIHSN